MRLRKKEIQDTLGTSIPRDGMTIIIEELITLLALVPKWQECFSCRNNKKTYINCYAGGCA
jgi:hypothetical protein